MENSTEKKVRILIADDYKPLHKIVQIHFEALNYEIDTALDGQEALDLIEKNNYQYDLLILDVMMPKVNGFDICVKVRQNYSLFELPILIVTAKKEIEDIVRGFDVGANDYLSKPFDKSELLSRSKTLVKLKRLTQSNDVLQKAINLKNQFINMNVHDLKNPLSTIILNSEMMLYDNTLDTESLSNIKKSANHMLRLIDEILEVSKIESGKYTLLRKEFDIFKLAESVVLSNVSRANSKKQVIQFNKNADFCFVNADEVKIFQILENLISNAIKYSPIGKIIKVSGEFIKKNNYNSAVRLIVADEGPGFSEEDKTQVFNQFKKLSARPTGNEHTSGLGLSIAKELSKMHDAKLWLESELGKGAKFIFEMRCLVR